MTGGVGPTAFRPAQAPARVLRRHTREEQDAAADVHARRTALHNLAQAERAVEVYRGHVAEAVADLAEANGGAYRGMIDRYAKGRAMRRLNIDRCLLRDAEAKLRDARAAADALGLVGACPG